MTKPKKPAPKSTAPKVEPVNFRNIDQGGIFQKVPAAVYHADPLPTPSISSGFLRVLDQKSPRHAWLTHPRLNPAFKPKAGSDVQNMGSAAHAAVLGAGRVKIIDAKSYQTDVAKTARAQALLNGEVPILKPKWETIQEMKRVLLDDLASIDSPIPNVFDPKHGGHPEIMAAWQEDGLWCRALADWWISPGLKHSWAPNGLIVDLKFTGESSAAEDWPRTLYALNGDIQPVWYQHGFHMAMKQGGFDVSPHLPRFIFIVQETFEPFAVNIFELDQVAEELARNKIIMAFSRAIACFTTGEWPKYPTTLHRITPPQWQVTREEYRRVAADLMHKG